MYLLLYWMYLLLRLKTSLEPERPPAERCAERFFAAVCTLAAGTRKISFAVILLCVLTGGRLCQAGYLVASQRCQKLNSLHLFGHRQKRI